MNPAESAARTSPTPQTLFLSDLHLPPEPSPLRACFLRFLENQAREAQAVYILGDLFESWIGDDVGLQMFAPEVAALAALTACGVPVFFQHGNRDFLVGQAFAQITGARILPDPHRIELDDQAILISHGDVFCTDDLGYQQWRRFARNRFAQWLFLHTPRVLRERIAREARSGSDRAKRNKADNIMDVNPHAVAAAMRAAGTTHLIHGHTHRPAVHRVSFEGREMLREVLADWRPQSCEVLEGRAATPGRRIALD